MNDILYDYVCEELEDVEKEGLKASNIESTDKLVNIKKNLLKIEKYENEMGDSYAYDDGGYWTAEGSYNDGMSYERGGNRGGQGGYSSARRGMHYVRGHYSRDDGMDNMGGQSMAYRGGSSYARRRDSRGRYSRAEAKDEMMYKLGEMMQDANEKERGILERAMKQLENA